MGATRAVLCRTPRRFQIAAVSNNDETMLTLATPEKEVHVKTIRTMAAAALIIASVVTPCLAFAQAPGIKRIDLQRNDLSVPGREVIQVLVEFDPGVVAPNHTHPGEEMVYVTEGSLEY